MKPHLVSKMSLPQRRLFAHVTHLLAKIPDDIKLPSGNELSSHVIAHAIVMSDLELDCLDDVIDGWYLGKWSHSWLADHKGNVYDVCPIGMIASLEGGPIFVAKDVAETSGHYETIEDRQEKFREMISHGETPPLDPDEVDLLAVKGQEFEDDVSFLMGFFE